MALASNTTRSAPIVHTVDELRALSAQWRKAGERIALVPTMGALHNPILDFFLSSSNFPFLIL